VSLAEVVPATGADRDAAVRGFFQGVAQVVDLTCDVSLMIRERHGDILA
jgi:hypothetical protein